ncbi:MAG: hypothetical protein U1E42_16000 [Rhodospirillales bacterium]
MMVRGQRWIGGYVAGTLVAGMMAVGAAGLASAQGTFAEHRVRFAPGAHAATVEGVVSREAAALYKVGARGGQSMTVSLDGDAKTVFDLSGPKDKSGQAMASSATEWEGTLPDNGDYTIFVFTQNRSKSPFTLKISIQ